MPRTIDIEILLSQTGEGARQALSDLQEVSEAAGSIDGLEIPGIEESSDQLEGLIGRLDELQKRAAAGDASVLGDFADELRDIAKLDDVLPDAKDQAEALADQLEELNDTAQDGSLGELGDQAETTGQKLDALKAIEVARSIKEIVDASRQAGKDLSDLKDATEDLKDGNTDLINVLDKGVGTVGNFAASVATGAATMGPFGAVLAGITSALSFLAAESAKAKQEIEDIANGTSGIGKIRKDFDDAASSAGELAEKIEASRKAGERNESAGDFFVEKFRREKEAADELREALLKVARAQIERQNISASEKREQIKDLEDRNTNDAQANREAVLEQEIRALNQQVNDSISTRADSAEGVADSNQRIKEARELSERLSKLESEIGRFSEGGEEREGGFIREELAEATSEKNKELLIGGGSAADIARLRAVTERVRELEARLATRERQADAIAQEQEDKGLGSVENEESANSELIQELEKSNEDVTDLRQRLDLLEDELRKAQTVERAVIANESRASEIQNDNKTAEELKRKEEAEKAKREAEAEKKASEEEKGIPRDNAQVEELFAEAEKIASSAPNTRGADQLREILRPLTDGAQGNEVAELGDAIKRLAERVDFGPLRDALFALEDKVEVLESQMQNNR